MNSNIKMAELFSGAGLMAGGFSSAGFKPVFAAELDPRAVESYNLNLHPVAEVWDATKVKPGLSYDVLVAGPPCQGFSTLGRRDPKDIRNGLSLCVFQWAKSHNPKVVVIENVPQFLDSNHWRLLHNKFCSIGYKCTTWVLKAEEFGVAQKRHRSFTIFSKIGIPEMPKKCRESITVKDAFHGLSANANGENLHISPMPSALALARMKLIPPKGDKRDVLRQDPSLCPESWKKMGNQAVDVWGRLDWKKPSNTIRCSFQSASKGRYLHPYENRVISLREGARLQGVPDHWMFHGDRTSIARQIGNGVPVPLAQAVAESVAALFQ